MTKEQFEPGEEVLARMTIKSGPDRDGLYQMVSAGMSLLFIHDDELYKISTGKNSFWTQASDDIRTIDGQCGGCGFVGKVSAHELCALCGWWSRREQWQGSPRLLVPEDVLYHLYTGRSDDDYCVHRDNPLDLDCGEPKSAHMPPPKEEDWRAWTPPPKPSLWQRIKRWWTEQGDW